MSDEKLSDDIFESPNISEQDNSIRIVNITKCISTQKLLLTWWQQTKSLLNYIPVVYTEHQTAGKGQKDKTWYSDEGSLTFSLILPLCIKTSWTSLEVSILLKKFFQETYGVSTTLKWPNDILTADGKKIAGILCHGLKDHVVVGIGINLYQVEKTSLSEQALNRGFIFNNPNISKTQILSNLVSYLMHHRYSDIEKLKSDWLNSCWHYRKKIKWELDLQKEEGIFVGLGDFGEGILELNSGKTIHITNGSLTIHSSSNSK